MSEQILLKREEGEREEGKRIRPDVLQTALLDDIGFRISSLENVIRGYIQLIQPEGRSAYEEIHVEGARIKYSVFRPLFSLHVWNDGPDEVFIAINKKEMRGKYIKLKKAEDMNFKYDVPVIRLLYHYCNSGKEADIRAAGVY